MTAPPATRGYVGRPVRRREDERILRGRTRYLDDVELPGLAHVAFVRSPHAHARVLGVRAPAGAVPGLLAVLTAPDLEGRSRPLPVATPPGVEATGEEHPLLARTEVGYVGQPVAAVVAESRALAEDAADLVEVDYEMLEPLTGGGEPMLRFRAGGGDVEAAFAAADTVVRATHAIPRLAALPMEPRGAVAAYDAERDELTVHCSAQGAHRALAQLAHALQRPEETIRVIVPDVGGGFGSKGSLGPEAVVTAVAAMDVGRPVKWAEDRRENFLAAYQGRGLRADVELALAADGRMLGLRAHLVADLGAYLQSSTAIPAHTTAMLMCGCYDIPAVDVSLVGERTSRVPVGPYRGAGRPEAAFAVERTVDAAARSLGMDPVELRRMNLVRSFPHRTLLGWTYDSGDYERCLDRAVELAPVADGGDAERAVGRGVAVFVERAGGQWESAAIRVQPTGRVVVRSGSSPHGQGHDTTFGQIAADALGVDLGDIDMRFNDSREVPAGIGTFASRSVAMGGSAVVRAAEEVIARGAAVAAGLLEVPAEGVTYREGRFTAADGRWLALADVAAAEELGASVRFQSDMVFSSGAYAAVVEIERATGRLTVRRLGAVDDGGRIINPLLAEGQVVGAIAQGLGAVLSEEIVYVAHGRPATTSLLEYGLSTAAELPPIETAFVESPSPLNPLGAKGVGEGGAIGTPAAIGNAVADALGGRHVDPPYTAERLWRALQEPR